MIDLGVINFEKEKVVSTRKNSKVPANMVHLLHNYLLKRSSSENKDDEYYVLGR